MNPEDEISYVAGITLSGGNTASEYLPLGDGSLGSIAIGDSTGITELDFSDEFVDRIANKVIEKLGMSHDARALGAAANALDALSCCALADLLEEHGLDAQAAKIRRLPLGPSEILFVSVDQDRSGTTSIIMDKACADLAGLIEEKMGFRPFVTWYPDCIDIKSIRVVKQRDADDDDQP